MRCTWLLLLATFSVGLTQTAVAQPLVAQTWSIESLVANSDLVVIANISTVGNGEKFEGYEVHQVNIVVQRTIKQDIWKNEPYDKLSLEIPRSAAVLEDWKKRSCRLLIALDSDHPKSTVVIELADDKLEIWKADFTLLRKPDDVIQAAQEAFQRLPTNIKRIHTFRLHVPRELATKTQWEKYYHTSGHLMLSVPVDQHLEKRAQDYLHAKEDTTRAEGVRALRYFKSADNIARAKKLLDDHGHVIRYTGNDGTIPVRFYYVRYEAFETLKSWGVNVSKPVLEEGVGK